MTTPETMNERSREADGSALRLSLQFAQLTASDQNQSTAWWECCAKLASHRRGKETVWECALRHIADSRAWYLRRVELLAAHQHTMRDPERTLVCDILANGQLLPDPNGLRYGKPNTRLNGASQEGENHEQR